MFAFLYPFYVCWSCRVSSLPLFPLFLFTEPFRPMQRPRTGMRAPTELSTPACLCLAWYLFAVLIPSLNGHG